MSVLIVTKSCLSPQLRRSGWAANRIVVASVSACEAVRAICTFRLTEPRSRAYPRRANSIAVENHMSARRATADDLFGRPLRRRAGLGESPLLVAAQHAGDDGRQDAVELLWAVDDPVAVDEPQHEPVDEGQRDVAEVVDHVGIQVGAVRQ